MSKKPIFAAGVDAGSSFTRCVIALLENEESASWAVAASPRRAGPRAASPISRPCPSAFCSCGEGRDHGADRVENVVAGIGGLTVRGANHRGRHDLGRPREITQRDINRAMDRAMRIQMSEDRMLLQLLPQDFVVDEHPGFHDPRAHDRRPRSKPTCIW